MCVLCVCLCVWCVCGVWCVCVSVEYAYFIKKRLFNATSVADYLHLILLCPLAHVQQGE